MQPIKAFVILVICKPDQQKPARRIDWVGNVSGIRPESALKADIENKDAPGHV